MRVKNSFINRVICIGSYLSCKLEGKLFSSEVKRELIRLNTKTVQERLKRLQEIASNPGFGRNWVRFTRFQ